jgi:hypothetical protein
MNHGPMSFWVACRESGSSNPVQESHRTSLLEIPPQNGQIPARSGAGWGSVVFVIVNGLGNSPAITPRIDKRGGGGMLSP